MGWLLGLVNHFSEKQRNERSRASCSYSAFEFKEIPFL